MPIEITMPRLSDTMQQGTVVKWNVKEGQKVSAGDVIADIETDKATMELQTFDDGTVARLTVAEGQTVPVGTVIAVLAGGGEDPASLRTTTGVPAAAMVQGSAPTSGATATVAETKVELRGEEPARSNGGRVLASPLARKIAQESGVDLSRIHGSGPGGRILRRDVEAAAGQTQTAPLTTARTPVHGPPPDSALVARVVPLSNMRRVIARRLVESKLTVPHYQVSVEVDMDALLDLRRQLNGQLESQGVKLSVNDFLVRACALAMHRHPYVNSRWVATPNAEAIELLADVNIGIAISLPEERGGGLVVGTIRRADRAGLRQISAEARRLADKARGKGLSPEEMSDATFTISNLGMFGVAHFTAIINPPNVAILAVGAAMQRPVVRNGQVVPGHVMAMTMSSDHRVVDGAMAAQFLSTVKGLLEAPATLLV